MKNILQITNDHMAERHNAQYGNPIGFVMKKAEEVMKEAERAKSDPSCLALSTHFAVELEQQLESMGVNLPPGVLRGLTTSAIAVAIREWEKINQEYEAQLAPPQPKQIS
jgi:hypothetical protein